MATFVAFDMNASTSDRLNALFRAAPKPTVHVPVPHLPHLPSMSVKNSLAPSIHVKEIPASSSWSISSAGSTRPSSIMEKRSSRGLKSMFSRNKMGSQSSHSKPEVIEEEEPFPAPMPSSAELHRALELTALELQEDISESSTTPATTPMSMNPLMSYIETPPTDFETPSLSESIEKNLVTVSASEITASESLGIHSIISKAKRMSITSIQGGRPSTATSTMSTPGTPVTLAQPVPTKKRSSIFPQRSTRLNTSSSSSSKASEPTSDGQEFVKALKEAKKHSTLTSPKLTHDAIITMSQWKEGEVLALGSKKSEKAKLKLKKQITDVINKSGWTNKIFVLTAGSFASPPFVLQFAPVGAASRTAERALQLTKQSRAFVTDAIPGRHWVLQVSQLLDTLAADAELKKAGSRMSFRPTEKAAKLANLLLILENGDDMEDWLTALRHEIEVLGGKGRHVEAVAEVPAEEVIEIALEPQPKQHYPTSSLSHESNLTRRDQPTSESDRGSWSGASQRQSASYSYRPSVDAASSTISSAEDRKLESLRNSGHSRLGPDNGPPTPASSTHSPAQSFSRSPAENTFLFDDTPEETEDDKAARAGYEYKATRQPPSIPTDPNVLRVSAKALNERRRSYQTQPPSPLVTELTPPGTASAVEAGVVLDAAPQRKRSIRTTPPTAFENAHHLSVVPDHPTPDLFEVATMPEVNPFDAAAEEEGKDSFPAELAPQEEMMNIPIPPRSARRQTLQTPMKLDLAPSPPAVEIEEPKTSPSVFEKRMSRGGSGGSSIKIQFWGPATQPQPQAHSRTASQEERLDELTAMPPPSIQSQMKFMKPTRSRASLGRSDPFDLENHLAAVSPIREQNEMDRYSLATSDSMYSEDSFADVESDRSREASLVPAPLNPITTAFDMSSPIARANARALTLRAERAAKRESWGMGANLNLQRENSIHKPSSRRGSRIGPSFVSGGRAPPKPLSARGFINLASAGAPAEEVISKMANGEGMTRLKRSASDAANQAPRAYTAPANYRASAGMHIGNMMMHPSQMGSLGRKNSLPRRSPVLGGVEEHPEVYTRMSAKVAVPGVGPAPPAPVVALPNVPPKRLGSVKSHRSQRSGRSGSGSGVASELSVRYEDDTGRRW